MVEYLGIILEHGIRCCENSVAGFVAEQHINNEIITIYPMQSMQVLHGIMNKSPQCTVAGSRFLHKCFLSAPPAELKEELGSVMQYIAPVSDFVLFIPSYANFLSCLMINLQWYVKMPCKALSSYTCCLEE